MRLIAVTGATGLIGRRLMPTLRNNGFGTRALVRFNRVPPNDDVVQGDLEDDDALHRLLKGAHAVVHLAGVAHTQLRNKDDEDRARAVNVEGTRRLARIVAAAGVRHFILMSSAHVYRGQAGLNVSENFPTEGDTPYGRLKLEAEQIVADVASHDLRVSILRPCLTYGPGVRFNLQALMRAIRKHYYVHVRGADVVRSMASVDTVASAVAHLLKTPSEYEVLNVADRVPVHLEPWVNHLAELMHVKHPHTVPAVAMRAGAGMGSLLRRAGIPAPITRDSMQKLTSSFSINTDRLAGTGFHWPETRETVLREMISAEIASTAPTRHGE